MRDDQTDKPLNVIAACRRCGRGYVWYPDYSRLCSLGVEKRCGGRVEPFESPVPNYSQRFPEWITDPGGQG